MLVSRGEKNPKKRRLSATRLSSGISLRGIARELRRDVAIVSKELERNSGRRGYGYKPANRKTTTRGQEANRQPTKITPAFIKLIEERLAYQWSPEQVAGRLKIEGFDISHETIYKHV